MVWTEIKLKIPTHRAEEAAGIANMVVPYGLYLEDYSDLEQQAVEIAHIDLIDEELLQKNRDEAVIHLYLPSNENARESLSFLKERFEAANIPFQADTGKVDPKDFENNWKKYFKSTEIGQRLCICPSWEQYNNKENRRVLKIDPGAAFGTGTHATTAMCLALLDQFAAPGQTVLDIGCGSGILSIAAVLLGAERATGIDIDPVAVKVAQENAALNGLSAKTEFLVGNLNKEITNRYSVVCANIVADVIMALAPDVPGLLVPGGRFLCSGIIDSRAEEVRAALLQAGLQITNTVTESNWVAFAAAVAQ